LEVLFSKDEKLYQVAYLEDIVTCGVVHATKMAGSGSDYWIYWHLGYNLSKSRLNTGNTALSLIYTRYNSRLQTHESSPQFTVPLPCLHYATKLYGRVAV
jgi:hypothetical protein